jgi:DNA-binding HxlR family transcriptional regulator
MQEKGPQRERSSPQVLSALANDTRIKILVSLHDAGSMSFTDLMRKIGMVGPVLVHHLDKLQIAGLVVKRANPDPNAAQYRLYEVTAFGEEMLETLNILPKSPLFGN